jgi:hypothetical protein
MNKPQEIALTEHQRCWLEHIRACDASGKGIAAYAADQGLDVKAMYAGKKLLVKKGVLPRTRPNRFVRAQVSEPLAANAWHIQLPNGIAVAFSGAVDASALRTVLTTAVAVD